MKKINILFFLIIVLNTITVFSQIPNNLNLIPDNIVSVSDSSLFEYFPLQKGNVWQYRYRDSPYQNGWTENMVCYGDTVMKNGVTYTKISPAPYVGTSTTKYCRIDSLYRIQEYIDSLCLIFVYDPPFCNCKCDSCFINKEISIFKLNESDSSYWSTCFNIGDNLFWPVLRYLGGYNLDAFGKTWEAKLFAQYNRIYDSSVNDSLDQYGNSFILVKGLGIFYTELRESSSATLEGAIINGVKYGTFVGVEENENKPASFTLNQNYPNPFNSQTVITFTLDKAQQIKLEVYNVLGQKVATLADDYLSSGLHIKSFMADNLSTGVYYLQLSSSNQISIKKMIYLK